MIVLRHFERLACSLLVLFASSGDSKAVVLVVDAAGGSGTDFVAIQPAVDAAQHGDTVLVATGSYLGFGIHGKGISVIAAAGAQVNLVSDIAVRTLVSDRQVSLVGLDVTPLIPAQRGLVAANNEGPVWVEDCHLNGSWGACLGNGFEDDAQPGLLAVDCDDLVLLRCVVFGGNGLDWGEDSNTFLSWGPGWGAAGADVVRSQVSVLGGRLRGGWGGSSDDRGANNGGHGVQLSDDSTCFAFLEGTRLIGGGGGSGGWSGGFGTNCGNGVHCIYAPSPTAGYLRDTVLVPGVGGPSASSSCSAGADG
ncbi:MAG: hypothetical protein ACI9F9_003367 [Candidatus Paceibacteria bacterium]|jgi:hypothetical protein